MKNCHKLNVDLNANRSNLLKRVLDSKLEKLEQIYKKSNVRQEIRNNILENKKKLRENSIELNSLMVKNDHKVVGNRELNCWSREVVKGVNHFEAKKVVKNDLQIKSFNRLVILTEAIKKTMENDKLDMATKIQAYKVLMNNIDDCMNPKMVSKEKEVETLRKEIGMMEKTNDSRENFLNTIKSDDNRIISHPHLKILATREVARSVMEKNQGLVSKIMGCYRWTKNWLVGDRNKGGVLDRVA
ncbi:MAG: hypothetical protein ACOZAR_00140 [Patescibacteria group bacterium]